MPEIFRVPRERMRDQMDLLLLADPDEAMIARYLDRCVMLAVREGETVLSEVCVEQMENGDWEIRNTATRPDRENQGWASLLIRRVLGRAVSEHRTVWVGTSPEGVGFYRRLGFRPAGVRRGFFLQYREPVLENGTRLEDMLMLCYDREETEWIS